MRPAEPLDLDYEFQSHHFPSEFWRGDVSCTGARQLIFATTEQLQLMKKAKTWYMDGIYRVVRQPFKQLYTIHVFILGENGEMKQVPTAYAFMSRRQEIDYRRVSCFLVFSTLAEEMGGLESLCVKRVMADSEREVWQAVRGLLPMVEIRGCLFHWEQAIRRKVQALGLDVSIFQCVTSETIISKLIKKLMALPYLHHPHIPDQFAAIKATTEDTSLYPLFTYAENTWLCSTVWPITSWSVYGMTVKTNNDCEGWHKKVNQAAGKKNLQFFLLVNLLHKEALYVPQVPQLLAWGQLSRHQSRKTRAFNQQIQDIWTEYSQGIKTPSQTLILITSLITKK
ncbi:uncharacterized protein LOC124285076 [Haliotis rubra]|uniref:uncharacterized protein LOC124285076 n=1 Tax=Haliotis rubra TaxID=36100 RepID=UPI001EE5F546|nr:uncharacterized protein LOC124285076 [Haliotis rubra]